MCLSWFVDSYLAMWKKGKPAHNKILLSDETVIHLSELFKQGHSITELMITFNLGRNLITKTLRSALADDYATYAKAIISLCASKAASARRGKKCTRTPEWNAKIAASNRGKKHSIETRTKISEANKTQWKTGIRTTEKHHEAMKKAVETKRARGYYEIHSKRHSIWMKQHAPNRGKKFDRTSVKDEVTRKKMSDSKKIFYANGGKSHWLGKKRTSEEIAKMSLATKKMWQDGKFDYGKNGIFSSKIENAVFEAFVTKDPKTVHNKIRLSNEERSYVFDIYVPSKNLLVEVNGDYWHYNPTKYTADYFDTSRNVKVTDVWDRDSTKLLLAINSGYNITVIWERDIKTLGVETIVDQIMKTD